MSEVMHCLNCNEDDEIGCRCPCSDCIDAMRGQYNKVADLLTNPEWQDADPDYLLSAITGAMGLRE